MLTKPQAFYDNSHKQALRYQNPFYLKKAQRIKPTLYDGSVISSQHVAMPVIDDDETLILEEVSRSKMSKKVKDPEAIKHNFSHKPIDYGKLNQLFKDFRKRFVLQQELSAEQAFWFQMSNSTTESSDASQFDSVVKIRPTLDALTEVFNRQMMFEIAKKELFLENDRLLQQIMSQDVLLSIINSITLNGESVSLDMQRSKSCDKCFDLDAELSKTQNAYNELLKSYSQLEKHHISIELSIQLNQEIFQKETSCGNQIALEIPEYLENNKLKAQLQAKDTTICKLKERIKFMREKDKKEKVKQDMNEIETINIELKHKSPKTSQFNDDPLHEDSTSKGSSSIVWPSHTPFELLVELRIQTSNNRTAASLGISTLFRARTVDQIDMDLQSQPVDLTSYLQYACMPDSSKTLTAYADANHVGCQDTRQSTSDMLSGELLTGVLNDNDSMDSHAASLGLKEILKSRKRYHFRLNVALRMFTRRVVILKRVEDLQLGVESYQKKLYITRPETFMSDISKRTPYNNPQDIIYLDKYKRNRLMCSDELYKFCDVTLTSVRTVLHDITSNPRMDYLPKRRWRETRVKEEGAGGRGRRVRRKTGKAGLWNWAGGGRAEGLGGGWGSGALMGRVLVVWKGDRWGRKSGEGGGFSRGWVVNVGGKVSEYLGGGGWGKVGEGIGLEEVGKEGKFIGGEIKNWNEIIKGSVLEVGRWREGGKGKEVWEGRGGIGVGKGGLVRKKEGWVSDSGGGSRGKMVWELLEGIVWGPGGSDGGLGGREGGRRA
ncbi:hypothetical protein Tco_0386457 [Tanacetum coccineum]